MNPTRTCASIPHIHVHCCSAPECLALFRLPPQPPLRLSRFLLRVVREREGGGGSKEAGGGAGPSPAKGAPPLTCPQTQGRFRSGGLREAKGGGRARPGLRANARARQMHAVPGEQEGARCGPAARVGD